MAYIKKLFQLKKIVVFVVFFSSIMALQGCLFAKKIRQQKLGKKHTKRHLTELQYGVLSSPRVAVKGPRMPRYPGRYHVGKPYKIAGKWYYPSKAINPKGLVGSASWYGKQFHGRLTANGEVFDMRHLTAAHPTMPLPSYARVTNLKNNASIIVRVNDRGPYRKNHIIDLSQRAAEVLGYMHKGIAMVKVQYIGKAPLHAKDDEYLLASSQIGTVKQQKVESLEEKTVDVAMSTNSFSSQKQKSFPTALFEVNKEKKNNPHLVSSNKTEQSEGVSLPETLDIAMNFNSFEEKISDSTSRVQLPDTVSVDLEPRFYADQQQSQVERIFSKVDKNKNMTPKDVIASWKKMRQQG